MNPLPVRFAMAKASLWALLLVLVVGMVGCEDANPQAIVVGTGNAGRVHGVTVMNGVGVSTATRLIRMDQENRKTLVAEHSTDSLGAFEYDSVSYGRYLIEAWQDGQICGRSDPFEVRDSVVNLIVVLVKPLYVTVDLRSLGSVDSAYLDYPGNPCLVQDSTLVVKNFVNDQGILYTKAMDSLGRSAWLTWDLSLKNGDLRLRGLGVTGSTLNARVDTGSFFPSKHTVALWSFDTVTKEGRFRDLSDNHNDLIVPSGKYLVPSPHGNALNLAYLPLIPVAMVGGDKIPASLQWSKTGMQTIKLRIKVDSLNQTLSKIMGTMEGFQIGVNDDQQIQIESRFPAEPGAWSWNTYLSSLGSVPLKQWTEIHISRKRDDKSFSLWVDGVPVPLYSILDRNLGFIETVRDTFGLSNAFWNVKPPQIQLDEMEVADTVEKVDGYAPQSVGQLGLKLNKQEAVAITFNDASSLDTALLLDSSSTLDVGGSRSLFVRANDVSGLLNRQVVTARIQLLIDTMNSGRTAFPCDAFRAYPSLQKKLVEGKRPLPGVDFDTVPFTSTQNGCLGCGLIQFKISTLAGSWAESESKNNGVVIRPSAGRLKNVRFKTQYVNGVDANYIGFFLR
ncbi:MAG: hypothetical protein IPK50_00830 [Fibrobacterota bacterium]|nr:MAG: hypothetical protein IPK50_00830 [Fibrobacterota bacterium]